MMLRSARRRRRVAPLLVAGSILLAPAAARPFPQVVATRGVPSSISADYGRAVPLGNPSVPGSYVIPTRWGIEIRDASALDPDPIGSFRTAGVARAVAVDGPTACLFAGPRGVVLVDLAVPAVPVAIGSRGDLGNVVDGAVSSDGYGLVASTGDALHFLARSGPGDLSLLTTRRFSDGRLVEGIRARSDSFLVVSSRSSPVQRTLLTLYRLPAGAAAPESLREIPIPLQTPFDLAWSGNLAFIAAGNAGVIVADLVSGAFDATTLPGSRFVRSVDVNDSVVVAATTASGFGRLRRSGTQGEVLVNPTIEPLALDPMHVALRQNRAIFSSRDVEFASEPDEVGRGAIEVWDLDGGPVLPLLGGTGRTRRVAWDAGLAYVADYTGGFGIYRAGGSDSTLIGALPLPGRAVDVALDPGRGLAFVAGSSAGLHVIDISNAAAPGLVGTFLPSGPVSCVAVVDASLVAVGQRGPSGASGAGLIFVDVTNPSAPVTRGKTLAGVVSDPRAVAVKDTVAFVADAVVGLVGVGFGDPAAPTLIGSATGVPANDLHASGNLLLVGSQAEGLRIADITNPAVPLLRAEVPFPPVLGVARSGSSAAVFLGDAGAAVVDATDPFHPIVRGPIAVPGFARDGVWVGDTLLVASRFALERFLVSPSFVPVSAIAVAIDPQQVQPRAVLSWSPVSMTGIAGLNVYRDILTATGVTTPGGTLVNPSLLDPASVQLVDPAVPMGSTVRYRLEAFFSDGSSRKVAEGTAVTASSPALGYPFPNPYQPASGVATIPFRAADGGQVEVTIHDARGGLVRRIVVPSPSGGFGSASWDGRDQSGRPAAQGIYFVRVHGPGIDDARRIVVLR